MKSKNKLIILGLLMAVFLGLPSINAFAAAIKWDGGAGTTNWNDANNWDGNVVPTSSDDVTLDNSIVVTAYTVNVNTAADVNSLTINETAGVILRPDASSARTMRVRDNLVLTAGSILYTNAGTTGRLSWTFDGSGAFNSIKNDEADEAKMQFFNLTIDGSITTPNIANEGDMEIYGNLVVNGSFLPSTTAGHSHVYFKGSGKTITNNGSLELNTVTYNNNSSYTTNTDLTVNGDMNVDAGSSLILQNPSIVTFGTATKTLTNAGTLTFQAGSSLNVNANTTLVGDLASFAGDLTVAAAITLKVTATNEIAGTGSITTGAASVINVNDGDGVAGAIDLDTYSWNATTDYIIEGGSTGFAGASITTVGDVTFGTNTGSALAISITEGFTSTGDITITNNAAGTTTVTATSGTITLSGTAKTIDTGSDVLNLYGLNITGTISGTPSLIATPQAIGISNYFGIATGGEFDIDNSTGTAAYNINFTSTNSIEVVDAGALEMLGQAGGVVTLNFIGTTTFLDDLTIAQGGDLADNFYLFDIEATSTVDFGTFFVSLTSATQDDSDLTSASGSTLKVGIAGGLNAAIADGDANIQIALNIGTNLEFHSNATTMALVNVLQAAGTDADFDNFNDLVINGAAITTTDATNIPIQVDGDITVTTGSLILSAATEIITVANTGDAIITNSTSTPSNLTFRGLVIDGANTVTTSGDFHLGAATDLLDFTTGAGTLDATTNDSHIYISGAGAINNTVTTGTANFHDLTIVGAIAVTLDPDVTLMNIQGDLTLDNAGGSLVGGALSHVTFNGSTEQTIDNAGTAASLDLDFITISNSVGVVTDDDMTFATVGGDVTISGKFTASSPSNVVFDGTGNLDVTGGEATFFDININVGVTTSTVGAGTIYLINNLTGLGGFTIAAATTLETTGNSADADAITNDGKLEALIDVVTFTNNGTVVVPSTAELQLAVVEAGGGDIDVNGRLQVTQTALTVGSDVDATGGTLHITAGAGVDDFTTVFTGTNVVATSTNIIIEGAHAAAGLGLNTLNFNNLTTNVGALVLQESFTINGTMNNYSATGYGTATSGVVTLAGATSAITSTGGGEINIFELNIAATATASTASANIEIAGTVAGAFEVLAGGAFTSTGTVEFNGAGATIVNGGDYEDLVFHDVTVTTAVASADDFSISGSVITNAALTATTNKIYFTGSGETITTNADDELNFDDVTFSGAYSLVNDDIINITGDLEVTNTGSFDMNSTSTIDFDGTATSQIINDGTLTLNNMTLSANSTTVTTSDDFTIEGNLFNTGGGEAFVASGSSLITFTGTTTLTGDDSAPLNTQFMSITVDGTVTLAEEIQISGNLIVNGTFAPTTPATDVVTFAGATTKTIQNNGTLTFPDLTINNVASNIVNTTSSFAIQGDLTVGGATGGKFEATAGTVTFNSGAAQVIDNVSDVGTNLKFFNLALGTASTAVTPAADGDFYVNGNLTLSNDALLDCESNDLRIFFAGSSQQDINLTSTGTLGTSARLFLHNATVNNSNGLKLVGTTNDIIVDQLSVQGTLRLQSGDLDLNGSNILTIDVNGVATAKLDETAGNTVVNNGPSTSTGHVYAVQTPGASLSNINFGGLGAIITSGDPGTLTVKRYHIPLTVGNQTQASRYYSIDGSTTTGLDAKLVFKYDASELGVLTEDDLILVYGDDPAVDVWTIQESTLNTDLRRLTTPNSAIDGFTGQTEWWTIGTPDVLTATSITNGLATTPISAGTNDNAIFGVQYTSNGSVDLSSVRFNLGRNLGATNEVAKWKLVYSEDDDFSTTEDNYTMIDVAPGGTNTTGGTSGLSYVTFDVSGQDAAYNVVNEGTPVNYFLVTDIVSTVTAATSTITPASTNLLTTITDGITEEFSLTGSAYAFRASIMVSPHEVGLTDAPLIAGQSDVVLFGYKASVTSAAGLPGITGFSLSFDQDPSAVFENVRVYSSVTEHDFADMAAGDLISLASSNVTSTEFDITFSAKRVLATTPTYFFVVADVKDGVRNTSPDITPTLTYANLESSDAGIRGTDINGNAASSHNGFVYSFVNSTVTVDVNNNTAASNLGTRVDRQPIFGFTLTPDNNQPVSFTGANLTVTLSAAALANNLSNWSLYYDANGNGFGETSEKIANGTLTSTSGVGNLTFTGFTQSLSSARKYLVGVKVGSGATAGSTVKVQLTSTDYITLASPAKLNATGPLPATAVTHTIRTAGTATALTLVHYNTSVTTGNTLGFTVRAVDANGYPTVVSAAETVTIAKVSGTGTVGGTATGTIVNGTNNVIVSPSLTAAAGSTDLVIVANGSSLTSSANSNAITILEAEPAANDAIVTIANITATTARITNITANSGSTDGRIVVIRQGSAPHVPTDATAYTASLDLASAGAVGTGQTGAGSYVVMANVAAGAAAYSNDITGLMPNTRYYVQVFDYNGTTPNFNYATGTAFTSESVRNPISFTTSSGDISSASTETLPANIQTDIDITSTISAADEIDWYQFKIPSTKNNAIIRLSNLPANYEVELYDASAGIINKTLLRDSKVTLQGDEVIILNNAAGSYVLKVYGANGDAYSTSSYTLRVSTSNNEIFSQVE